MFCNDPFLTYLKSQGYSPVRLPKADFRPLEILTRQGSDLVRIGPIEKALDAGPDVPLPPIRKDIPSATISGWKTSDLSLGIGLSIMGNAIGAMGGSTLGLEAQFKNAKSLAFEFQEVLEDSVAVADLDKFLANADVNPFSKYVGQLLDADAVYVTTATIKSDNFSIDATKVDGSSLAMSIPDIQGVVGGNVKVEGNGSQGSKISYRGKVPLVFGFQAVRLYYDQGRYTTLTPLQPGALAARTIPLHPRQEALVAPGSFVSLSELAV